MTKAELLLQDLKAVQQKIEGLKLRLDKAESDRQCEYDRLLRCTSFTKAIGQTLYDDTGRAGDPTGEAVTRIIELFTDRITNIKLQLEINLNELRRLENIIDGAGLNDVEYKYIQLRYIDNEQAWKAAQGISYSERQALRVKRTALYKITKAI